MQILTIETPSLGDRTYVVHDGEHAAVVDPQRDIDRVTEVLTGNGLTLTAIFETHIHNDYVTGGLELAGLTGAAYHVAAAEPVAFERVAISDGDEVEVGTLTIVAVHTPGHTPTHLSYVVRDADGRERAVLTGGGLIYGSVGRTDLIGPDVTEELTRQQYRSVHRLADRLPDHAEVLPTHGFGSFCSAGDTSGRITSTIGQERLENDALVAADEDAFVANLLAGLDEWPAYYAYMAPTNREGPAPVDLSPVTAVDVTELRRRIHAGEWVVDLRTRKAFANGHLVGTINVELSDSLSTYLGWIIPWGTPVTLIGEAQADVAEAQRQLVRIGIDRPAGQALTADLGELAGRFPSVTLADLADAAREAGAEVDARNRPKDVGSLTVVDARLNGERSGGFMAGTVHVPLHEMLSRAKELEGGPVWVHCASGYRAAIAGSLLVRAGHDVVVVDGEFETAGDHLVLTQPDD